MLVDSDEDYGSRERGKPRRDLKILGVISTLRMLIFLNMTSSSQILKGVYPI